MNFPKLKRFIIKAVSHIFKTMALPMRRLKDKSCYVLKINNERPLTLHQRKTFSTLRTHFINNSAEIQVSITLRRDMHRYQIGEPRAKATKALNYQKYTVLGFRKKLYSKKPTFNNKLTKKGWYLSKTFLY